MFLHWEFFFLIMSFEINDTTFRALYNEHFKPLVYFARKKGMADPEDMVTDKFAKLWEQRTAFTDQQSIKGFLYISVHNAIKNYYKHQSKKKYKIILLAEMGDIEDEIVINEIETQVLKLIINEIEKLPPLCKRIVKMKINEGKKNPYIAQLLNLSIKTVENHFTYGMNKIRAKNIKYEL